MEVKCITFEDFLFWLNSNKAVMEVKKNKNWDVFQHVEYIRNIVKFSRITQNGVVFYAWICNSAIINVEAFLHISGSGKKYYMSFCPKGKNV